MLDYPLEFSGVMGDGNYLARHWEWMDGLYDKLRERQLNDS